MEQGVHTQTSADTRAALLAGMKADVPATAMAAPLVAVHPHLTAGKWAKLSADLAP
jgi:hypothetical protein